MSETASSVQPVGVAHSDVAPINGAVHVSAPLFTFGVFELDAETSELRKEGRLIHLRLQPVSVLRLLLERTGNLVTRKEIISALWPDDLDVDVEQGLNHCMKEIRAALGDRPQSPRFIQTLPRRGYRFLLDVRNARWIKPPNTIPVTEPVRETSPAGPPVESGVIATSVSVPPNVDAPDLRVTLVVTSAQDETVLWCDTRDGHARNLDALERDVRAALSGGLQSVVSSNGDRRESVPAARDHRFE